MKKFYLLSWAVVIALTGMAQSSLLRSDEGLQRNLVQSKSLVGISSESSFPKMQPTRTDSKKKLKRNDLLGTYIYDEFRYANAHVGWEPMYCFPEIVAGDSDDEVIIEGFWADYDTSFNPPVPISRVKAKFDYENQTLSFPAGTHLGTYGDYPAYIYVSDWATDVMQPDSIVLHIDPETRCISYWCPRVDDDWNKPISCLIVTSYPDAVGEVIPKGVDFIGAILMNKYNQLMTVRDSQTQQPGYCPIYLQKTDTGFSVWNFGNYGYDLELPFTVDLTSGKCSANALLCFKDYQISESETADLWIASENGGSIEGSISATSTPEVYAVNIPGWCLYNTTSKEPQVKFGETYFEVNLGRSGVDVIGEDNLKENQTPIYYTLDGLRVENPAKGSIVICRQGSKVTKKIVR